MGVDDGLVFYPGQRVSVNYKQLGTYYAPGTISRRNVDGTYAIDYDDGEKEQNVDGKLIYRFGEHPPAEKSTVENEGKEQSLMMVCCMSLMACSLLAAVISFIVFGIMFLVQDQDVCEHYSPLFVFGVVFFIAPCCFNLTSMCIAGLYLVATKTKAQIEYEAERQTVGRASSDPMVMVGAAYQTPVLFLVMCCVLTIATYGALTLYGGYTCDEMKSEPLYIWAQVAVWYYYLLLVCFIVAYFVSAKAYKKWELEYDQKMLNGGGVGGSATGTGAATTTTESTPLVGPDIESHLD